MVEADIPQMTREYGACALHAGELRLQTRSECIIPIDFFTANIGYANAQLC